MTEDEIVARATRSGVAVEGLGGYARGYHSRAQALVVGYATAPGSSYAEAVARLCTAIAGPGG
jgi:DNA-binding transcriptional MocR family regulator